MHLQNHVTLMDTTPIKLIKELELDTNPIVDMIVDDMHLNSAVSQPSAAHPPNSSQSPSLGIPADSKSTAGTLLAQNVDNYDITRKD